MRARFLHYYKIRKCVRKISNSFETRIFFMKLSELKAGARGRIIGFENSDLELKLMEMGCLPGETIVVEQIAPLGGPMNIRVAGYLLSLRKDEATHVEIERVTA